MKRNALLLGQLAGVLVALAGAAILLPLGWTLIVAGVASAALLTIAERVGVRWEPAPARPSPFSPAPRDSLTPAYSPLSGQRDALDGME